MARPQPSLPPGASPSAHSPVMQLRPFSFQESGSAAGGGSSALADAFAALELEQQLDSAHVAHKGDRAAAQLPPVSLQAESQQQQQLPQRISQQLQPARVAASMSVPVGPGTAAAATHGPPRSGGMSHHQQQAAQRTDSHSSTRPTAQPLSQARAQSQQTKATQEKPPPPPTVTRKRSFFSRFRPGSASTSSELNKGAGAKSSSSSAASAASAQTPPPPPQQQLQRQRSQNGTLDREGGGGGGMRPSRSLSAIASSVHDSRPSRAAQPPPLPPMPPPPPTTTSTRTAAPAPALPQPAPPPVPRGAPGAGASSPLHPQPSMHPHSALPPAQQHYPSSTMTLQNGHLQHQRAATTTTTGGDSPSRRPSVPASPASYPASPPFYNGSARSSGVSPVSSPPPGSSLPPSAFMPAHAQAQAQTQSQHCQVSDGGKLRAHHASAPPATTTTTGPPSRASTTKASATSTTSSSTPPRTTSMRSTSASRAGESKRAEARRSMVSQTASQQPRPGDSHSPSSHWQQQQQPASDQSHQHPAALQTQQEAYAMQRQLYSHAMNEQRGNDTKGLQAPFSYPSAASSASSFAAAVAPQPPAMRSRMSTTSSTESPTTGGSASSLFANDFPSEHQHHFPSRRHSRTRAPHSNNGTDRGGARHARVDDGRHGASSNGQNASASEGESAMSSSCSEIATSVESHSRENVKLEHARDEYSMGDVDDDRVHRAATMQHQEHDRRVSQATVLQGSATQRSHAPGATGQSTDRSQEQAAQMDESVTASLLGAADNEEQHYTERTPTKLTHDRRGSAQTPASRAGLASPARSSFHSAREQLSPLAAGTSRPTSTALGWDERFVDAKSSPAPASQHGSVHSLATLSTTSSSSPTKTRSPELPVGRRPREAPPAHILAGKKAAPRLEYALAAHPSTVFARVLEHLSYADFAALRDTNRGLRALVDAPAAREIVLQRFLGRLGYRSMLDSAVVRAAMSRQQRSSPTDVAASMAEQVALSLRDLDAFERAARQVSPSEYASLAQAYMHGALDSGRANLARASARAFTRLALRLRVQGGEQDQNWGATSVVAPLAAPYVFARRRLADGEKPAKGAVVAPGTLYKPGRAPVLRVWVPTREAWMRDEEIAECEKELFRAGVWPFLQRGHIVWNVAVRETGNIGRLIFDGRYLRDFDFTYDRLGHIPSYLDSLAFSPAYFHNCVHSTAPNAVVHLCLRAFARDVRDSLQLCAEQVARTGAHGTQQSVKAFVYRAQARIVAGTLINSAASPGRNGSRGGGAQGGPGRGPGGLDVVHAEWHGSVVLEAAGTTEQAALLLARVDADRPTPWRVLRERSRPGRIWLTPVAESERV